jgi:hypothetical protein
LLKTSKSFWKSTKTFFFCGKAPATFVGLTYSISNVLIFIHAQNFHGNHWSKKSYLHSIYQWVYSPCGPWPVFQSLNLYKVGRTPWTGDQSFARPTRTHGTTQIQKTQTDIHASSGIRTHDPSLRAGEDGSAATVIGILFIQFVNTQVTLIFQVSPS